MWNQAILDIQFVTIQPVIKQTFKHLQTYKRLIIQGLILDE